jgi:hypothetical protein
MLKSTATGAEFRATTNDQGIFVFSAVEPGRYSVTVEATGFKRTVAQNIVVEVSQIAQVSIVVELGSVTETVNVMAVQDVINTVSPVLSNVINTRQVQDLPLPSRNPLDLARLQAGIAVVGTDTRNASVGGLRGAATNVTQDGINAMDNFVKTSSFFAISAPSLNSTSEFSIAVGTVGSDSGRGVAQVRLVTASGTNDFHGSLFYQHRNDALNANDFFNNASGVERERERQHFFGFALGGPVVLPRFGEGGDAFWSGRDRSFWFFSYEGFREPFSVTRNRTVLTEQARKGIFRYVGSNGQIQSVNLLQIGNANQLNPLTMAQINAMPLPNNELVGDGLNTAGARFNVPGSNTQDRINLRYDHRLVENTRLGSHRLEFVLNRAKFLLTPDTFNGLESPFPGGIDAEQGSTRWLTTIALHSNFGTTTNELRWGHQRAPVGFLRQSDPDGPFFINLSSVTDFNNTFMSQGRNTMVYQLADNFIVPRGSHTFTMGGDFQSITADTFNDAGIHQTINIGTNTANPNGILNSSFPFLPSGSSGTAIANRARTIFNDITGFLASTTQTFNVTSPTSGFVEGATRARIFKQRDLALYFQDQWRAKRNLTLNYGLRWEYEGVPTIPNGLSIQPTNVDDIFGVSGPGNLFQPGVFQGSLATTLDFVSGDTGKGLYNDDWNNFAPFFGFAYSPDFRSGWLGKLFGSEGRSSLRGGYSVSYLRDGFTVVSNALGVGTTNPGLIQTAANTTPTGVLTGAGVALTTPNFSVPITDFTNFNINPGNGLWAINPNLRTPYVQQWSFGIERQIASNMALEVRYVANHAIKVFRATDYNEVNIFENGFLQEFLNAQKNLAARGGSSFAPGVPGTVALPILSTLFAGLPASSGFSNSTFINNLNTNNVGAMASSLAFATTFKANRTNLTRNFFVMNPNAAFIRLLDNNSYSNYHSLQVEIRRRLSRGLQFQANYTFSKAITDSNGSQSNLESFRTLRDPGLDRALSDLDQKHRFIANFLYDLPLGSGQRFLNGSSAIVDKMLSGWTIGSIINWQSRPPFFITSNRSTFNSFNPGANPAQLVGISFEEFRQNLGVFRHPAGIFFINPNLLDITTNPTTGRLVSATLKPGLLGPPTPGTFGNFPRNSLTGPAFWQADFSLVKRTSLSERVKLEFTATLLNAFNHANFIYSGENFDDATFGLITSQSGDPRIIHFKFGLRW